MTEDEAKRKWCPFARVPMSYLDNSPAPAVNRAYSGNSADAGSLCIASACMAWRVQRDIATNAETGISRAVVLGGYCGLAGAVQ